MTLSAGPEVGEWKLPGTSLKIDEKGNYLQEPLISGGGRCKGRIQKTNNRYIFYDHQCTSHPDSDDYSPYGRKTYLNCEIKNTPEDLISNAYLLCSSGKKFPSTSNPAEENSRRKYNGMKVIILKGKAVILSEGPFYSQPSLNAKKIQTERQNADLSTFKSSILEKGLEVECVAKSVSRFSYKNRKGYWYYIRSYDSSPSYAIERLGWFFSENSLKCK